MGVSDKRKISGDEISKNQQIKWELIDERLSKKYDPLFEKIFDLKINEEIKIERWRRLEFRFTREYQKQLKKIGVLSYNHDLGYRDVYYKGKRVIYSKHCPPYGFELGDTILHSDHFYRAIGFQEKTCPNCKKSFRTFKLSQKYCCPLCAYKFQIKTYIKKRKMKTVPKRYYKTCSICNKEFTAK